MIGQLWQPRYARTYPRHTLGLCRATGYDCLTEISQPFVLAQLIMELVMIHLGFGADISGLSREAQLPIFKLLFAFYMIYDIGVSFAKASTLFFLRRAFPTYVSPAWFNIGLWVIHFLNIGWLIGMIFATTFVCDPVAKVWNPFLDGDCVPQASLWIGNAMSSVAIDLLILLLPLPRVWALRVTRLTRLGITIVLGFGYGSVRHCSYPHDILTLLASYWSSSAGQSRHFDPPMTWGDNYQVSELF